MKITFQRFSSRLGRKLKRVERKAFPDHDRGLGDADESSWAFVAWEGQAVGYILVDFDDEDVDCEVLDFAVHPNFRGAGLNLLLAFRRMARERGWHRVRAALRRQTWEGKAVYRMVTSLEGQDEEYDYVVLSI